MVRLPTVSKFFGHLFIVFAILFSVVAATPSVGAQYGTCSYSEGSYSREDHSCNPAASQTDGGLSETGANWQYLLFAALGLLITASSAVFIIIILKKSRASKSSGTKTRS